MIYNVFGGTLNPAQPNPLPNMETVAKRSIHSPAATQFVFLLGFLLLAYKWYSEICMRMRCEWCVHVHNCGICRSQSLTFNHLLFLPVLYEHSLVFCDAASQQNSKKFTVVVTNE